MIDPLLLKVLDCPPQYDPHEVWEEDEGCAGGLPSWKVTGLVTYTYFSGGSYFTIGACKPLPAPGWTLAPCDS